MLLAKRSPDPHAGPPPDPDLEVARGGDGANSGSGSTDDDEEAKQIALEKHCLQEVYPVIFGGHNRLMWHPITGWTISASHCTPNFIATFKEIMASGEWKTE